jgi:hypothetical protein
MKVKITYTTDFDDVPSECRNLIINKIGNSHEITNYVTEIVNHIIAEDVMKATEQIHKLRLALSTYDQCLDDVNTILNGWLNVRLQKQQERVNIHEQQPQEESQQDYQQILENLKNTLQNAVHSNMNSDAEQTESV